MFVMGIISFVVLLPIAGELSPIISNTMGGVVTNMVGAMLLIVVVMAMIMYWRSSQSSGYYPPPEYGYEQ